MAIGGRRVVENSTTDPDFEGLNLATTKHLEKMAQKKERNNEIMGLQW